MTTINQLASEAVRDYEILKDTLHNQSFTSYLRGYFAVASSRHSELTPSQRPAFMAIAELLRQKERR